MRRTIVTAVVRRRAARDGVSALVGYADPLRVMHLHTLWERCFPSYPYPMFRAFLAAIADSQSSIPRIDDGMGANAEWLAFVDDDDWHLPGLAEALENVPPEFVMACWPVRIARLTRNPGLELEALSVSRGPHTCGYAVQRDWFGRLTPRQQALIRDDHRHAHRYVDFAGWKYITLDGCFGQYVYSPASITSIAGLEASGLNLARAEEYEAMMDRWPPGVREVARRLIELLREASA